jgi:hypothetical protein
MKLRHLMLMVTAAAAVATAYGARRAAWSGAQVPPEAVALHGAAELYRSLAVYFGKQALRAEAHYWKVVGNG